MTLPNIIGPPSPGPHVGDRGDRGIDTVHAYRLLRRRLRLTIAIAILLTAIAALAITYIPPTYTAETTLVLDPRRSKINELMSSTDTLLSRSQADLSAIRTQTDLLLSPMLLRRVVESLDLARAAPSPRLADRVRQQFLSLARDWGLPTAVIEGWLPATAAEPAASLNIDAAVERLGRSLAIVNEGGSYVIRIRAEARDPLAAAQIANAVAHLYLDEQSEASLKARDTDAQWLSGRLAELRANVIASENALETFRAERQLGTEVGNSALDRQMDEVNRNLIAANTQQIRAQTNFDQLESAANRGAAGDISSVMASSVIQALRAQEAAVLAQQAQLKQQFGPLHPEMITMVGELASIRAKIQTEADRIVAAARSDVQAARAEVSALQAQLGKLQQQRDGRAGATVQLAELSRQAQAADDVYQLFLTQFATELARTNVGVQEARVVAEARPPVQPSGPPRRLMMVAAALASLGTGALLALLVGYARGGFSHAAQLASATGVPVSAVLPETGRRQREGSPNIKQIAYILMARHRSSAPRPIRVLLTSSTSGEGKSFVASGLASALAMLGAHVLLVELDFWSRARATPAPKAKLPFLGSYTDEPEGGSIDVVPIQQPSYGSDSGAALRSRLASLPMTDKSYDYVLLDGPSILSTPDILAAAGQADEIIMAVRFERTRAAEVQLSLDKLAAIDVRPTAMLLTRVIPRLYRRYGYGKLV